MAYDETEQGKRERVKAFRTILSSILPEMLQAADDGDGNALLQGALTLAVILLQPTPKEALAVVFGGPLAGAEYIARRYNEHAAAAFDAQNDGLPRKRGEDVSH